MMVERSPYVENVGQLLRDLDQAASKLMQAGQAQQGPTHQEMKSLISVLQNVNTTLDPSFWTDKKLAPEGMNATIEKALKALELFQTNPQANRGAQKTVDQAVASLFSTLSKEIKDFDKNLRNLKKYKFGRRVEKSSESKDSDKQEKER